ncbi:MAG: MBL fold metallo-hydrolase [Proteobacteria bacterium]|nr:MBL fold metallo-hydrolase [Pseudomonadota bacterium]
MGRGVYAWLAASGAWGYSNAGLVVDGDQALLVDTLFDLPLTREMLTAMRGAEPGATTHIDFLVNTHANGDHCHGNELVAEAEIIASRATTEEMQGESPERLAALMRVFGAEKSPLGRYLRHCFGDFVFEGIQPTRPTTTFDGGLTRTVGDKRVELIEVGPAHTRGDVLVHIPADRVVYTGDILFVDGTPIVWAGPVSNWIAACDRILALDVELVVPGHGPVTDRRGVEAVKSYLDFVQREARIRFEAGLTAEDAARDIALGDFGSWGEAERIAVNVATLYREFAADPKPADVIELFRQMAVLAESR